ncbi:RHS repeat-associated core domain-containing protein, partial [Leptospira santarosai]
LTDQVDSVSHVLDDEGNTLSQIQYQPYGETFVQRGDLNFSPKYNSQELDRESGFYFYNARYYDPGIARFTSADTLIPDEYNSQGWNRFAYVYNNPIGAKDPTGHVPQDYDAGFKDSSKGIVKGAVDSVKSALSAPTPVDAAVNSAVATGKGVYELAKDYKGTYEKVKDFAGKLTSKDDKVRDYAAGQAAAHTMSAVLGGM